MVNIGIDIFEFFIFICKKKLKECFIFVYFKINIVIKSCNFRNKDSGYFNCIIVLNVKKVVLNM